MPMMPSQPGQMGGPPPSQMQPGQGGGPDQASEMFEQGFSSMAYNTLISKHPDLMEDIVTFKVLDTDVDQGKGVGAFVLQRQGRSLYIPVVLADNQLKPLDVIYDKRLNQFLPLTKGWLDELDKLSLTEMGKGVKTPETLYTDVDIRNIMVPPITGRFSYAEYIAGIEKTSQVTEKKLLPFLVASPDGVKVGFARFLEKHPPLLKHAAAVYGVKALIDALSSRTKKGAATLSSAKADITLPGGHVVRKGENITILPYDHEAGGVPIRLPNGQTIIFGHAHKDTPEKTAALVAQFTKTSAKQLFGGGLWIADKDTTPTEFRRIFGDQAAEAFSGVKLKGYKAKDTRTGLNRAVQEQPYTRFTEPGTPGVYTLFKTDGKEVSALVIPDPINIFAEASVYGRRAVVPAHTPPTHRTYPEGRPDEAEFLNHPTGKRFFAVLGDGSWLETDHLVGRDNVADGIDGSTLHKRLFENIKGEPKVGFGFFVRARGTSFEATRPMHLHEVTEGADGARRIRASRSSFDSDYGVKTLVTDPKVRTGTIQAPRASAIVMLPMDFIWVPLKGEKFDDKGRLNERSFFRSPFDLSSLVANALQSVGIRRGSLKNAGHGQYSIDGRRPTSKTAALHELAMRYYIPVTDAEVLLEKVSAETPHVRFYAATARKIAEAQFAMEKRAGDDKPKKKEESPKKKPAAGGGAPPQTDPGMDPNADPNADPAMQQAMMQQAMQPPPPPPPSPSDLAGMEMQQQIEHEMQKLQEKAQMLASLMQRTQEIAGGAPVMPTVQTQAMGAPPPSMNMATGQPMGGQMPPGPFPGAQPPGMGGDPGMDPVMGGMPDPSMGGDPAAMGQQGMGPDPAQLGQESMGPGQAQPPGMATGMDPSMGGMQPQPPPMAMMGENGPDAASIEHQINPQFLDQAAQLQHGDAFDAAAVSSLAQSPAIKEMVGQYVPNLEKAIDNLGRVMLTLWMQEGELKEDVGEEAYARLEDRLRTTFQNLGDLVLNLNQNAHIIPGRNERALA